ncbi:hypothetical protein C8Q78DRAFT_382272 [Trametes maxima]|nr:hypothetical protein C8Q78DRAFT_382272 [Trametes maxima]
MVRPPKPVRLPMYYVLPSPRASLPHSAVGAEGSPASPTGLGSAFGAQDSRTHTRPILVDGESASHPQTSAPHTRRFHSVRPPPAPASDARRTERRSAPRTRKQRKAPVSRVVAPYHRGRACILSLRTVVQRPRWLPLNSVLDDRRARGVTVVSNLLGRWMVGVSSGWRYHGTAPSAGNVVDN